MCGPARSIFHNLMLSNLAAGRGKAASIPPRCALTAFCATEILECWRLFLACAVDHLICICTTVTVYKFNYPF